jgi:hypothetical protein
MVMMTVRKKKEEKKSFLNTTRHFFYSQRLFASLNRRDFFSLSSDRLSILFFFYLPAVGVPFSL